MRLSIVIDNGSTDGALGYFASGRTKVTMLVRDAAHGLRKSPTEGMRALSREPRLLLKPAPCLSLTGRSGWWRRSGRCRRGVMAF